ncbi:calmodulin-like [Mya arenaria]|uniref:calmodulin-like n=1 Tax=Mya arenaria TaxID=6604 RepID=UPI0022E902BF|nr:calmodulin-like [Mya arenaria]
MVQQNSDIQSAFERQAGPDRKRLSQVEARTALYSLGLNPTSIDVAKFWADQDLQDDGEIDLLQFERLRCSVDEDPAQALRWAFNKFDTNGDGTIDKHELLRILRTVYDDVDGELVDEDFTSACLTMADSNGDGVLQIEEFVDMLMARSGKDGSSNNSTPTT